MLLIETVGADRSNTGEVISVIDVDQVSAVERIASAICHPEEDWAIACEIVQDAWDAWTTENYGENFSYQRKNQVFTVWGSAS